MKDNLALTCELTDGGNILDHADFVVDVHDGNQNSLLGGCRFQFFQIEQAIVLWIQVSDLESLAFELTTGIKHRLMLGFERDDVIAFLAIKVRGTLDSQVVRLGRAAGPDNFTRIRIDQICNLLARVVYSLFSAPAKCMAAGCRVTKITLDSQAFRHLGCNPLIDWCGCTVIKVNRQFDVTHFTSPVRPPLASD